MGINLKKHMSGYINAAGWFHVKIKSVEAGVSNNDKKYLDYHFADTANGRTGKARLYTTDEALWALANFCADIGISDTDMENFDRKMPVGMIPWVRMEMEEGYHNPVQWKPDSDTAPADVVTQSTAKEPERAIDRDDNSEQPTHVEEAVDEDDIPF